MQIKEGGAVQVDEIVAVTMGPETAVRALHKAVSLGADRSVHLSDDALAGSDVAATGYALAQGARAARRPTWSCSASSPTTASATRSAPSWPTTCRCPRSRRSSRWTSTASALRCERQAEYGYDTVQVAAPRRHLRRRRDQRAALPVAQGDHGREEEAARHARRGRRRHRRRRRSAPTARSVDCGDFKAPPAKAGGTIIEDEDTDETVEQDRRLARREEADLMAGILVYALHYEGAFNKNSLGAVSEARQARRRARRRVPTRSSSAAATSRRALRPRSARYGATKVFRAEGPEGLAQPVVDVMAKVIDRQRPSTTRCSAAACSASRSAPASPRACSAGVTMEVTAVNVEDGKLVAERPILGDSPISTLAVPGRPRDHHRPPQRVRDQGVRRRRRPRSRTSRRALALVDPGDDGPARRAARRRREHRGRRHPRRRRPRPRQGRGLRALRGARGRARRRRRRHPRGGRRRLVPLRRADRPDGQDRRAEALPRGGHLRRDPAQGRHAGLGEHRGDQQGRERPDLRVLRPRHRRRPQQDPARSSPRP